MAKAVFVKKAQKTLYKKGTRVEYTSERGKRAGQTLSKIDKTIPNPEGDEIFVEKGQPYWWWQFMNGGKHFSLTQPKNSQLTQSSYLSTLYGIQEQIEETDITDPEDFESFKDELVSQIEELRDECQSSLDNMPEHLQESSVLTERVETLENVLSELESMDFDYESIGDNEEEIAANLEIYLEEKMSEFQNLSFE